MLKRIVPRSILHHYSEFCISRYFSTNKGFQFPLQQNNEQEEAIKYALSKVDQVVKESDVVIFMKGKPNAPKCGYSRIAANLLAKYPINIAAVDVLENELVRQAIKQYSSWPTIPQIFVKGEFIGGSDILMQMHQNGELTLLFEKHEIISKQ